MIEVKITEEMKKSAWAKSREMGVIKNSIMKGDGNIAGFLGEEVANVVIGGTINNTYDYDLVAQDGTKYDVKTKRCTSPPKPYYDCSVANFNTKQKCDRYVFVRIENKNKRWGRAWVLGWLTHDDYFKKARKLTKGQKDPSNGFVVRADCHNVAISELNKFKDCHELDSTKQ
ncbi:hypothetical protein N8257_00720 [Ulvibacter sp.]|jgi:hypothetical protein|nr:hypothetical protein [Ulvibacter sp.]|tara:strand:+ start:30 stop:545 length:516 start_codon:yes stop_codon:yes gene_type:complete